MYRIEMTYSYEAMLDGKLEKEEEVKEYYSKNLPQDFESAVIDSINYDGEGGILSFDIIGEEAVMEVKCIHPYEGEIATIRVSNMVIEEVPKKRV
jgi:hypothetical protein